MNSGFIKLIEHNDIIHTVQELWSKRFIQRFLDHATGEILIRLTSHLGIETNATTESLTELRSQIDKLDDELLELLSRRMRVSRDIGQYKKEHNMPVLQAQRYGELLTRRADQAVRMGMDREFMRSVLQAIHEESIRQQMAVLGE